MCIHFAFERDFLKCNDRRVKKHSKVRKLWTYEFAMTWTTEERARALGMLETRAKQTDVARVFDAHRSTVSRLVTRYRVTGAVTDLPRSGRPRATTLRQDKAIRLTHLRNRFKTATSTASETPGRYRPRISRDTVLRRLRSDDIRCRRPYVGAHLTPQHRRRRRQWAVHHQRYAMRRWRYTLFTDECKIMIDSNDRRQHVFRRAGERHSEPCVKEVDRYGISSTMIWGGISYFGKTNLVFINRRGLGAQGHNGRQRQQGLTAQRYVNEIIRPVVQPYIARHQGMTLQQDNARPHTARVTQQYLQNNNIPVLQWPAYFT